MQERAASARTLGLVRHAKAEASAPSDHERRLAERGRQDAAEAGRWLAGIGVAPDHALVSDAARAVETWEELALGAGWDPDAETSAGLYAAGPESALDLLRDCPPEARTLVVVGHNPTMATLAELLDDGEGDEDAITELVTGGFPTAAVAVLDVEGDWSDLAESGATVRAFHVGRG
jgi:phosphohistidine phosphatase